MNNFFQNKVILITGATSGIGKALAIQLLHQGAKVAVCSRNADNLLLMATEINTKNLLTVQADVSNEADCKNFIEKS